MRHVFFTLPTFFLLTACATTETIEFASKYSDSEIAKMSSEHFEILERDAKVALGPTFNKYGAPDAYIEGLMSSIDIPNSNYLYGSGEFETKLRLKEHTFWRIDGENLAGHLEPVKTAHLVYETLRLDPLSDTLEFTETLTKRGQTFTVFERQVGNEIIITFHKSGELPQTTLDSVSFFP
ncbi:hypothetical protein N9W89_10390 [Hellea sp.]|nr:hypothetical protein [Hellea sp.]